MSPSQEVSRNYSKCLRIGRQRGAIRLPGPCSFSCMASASTSLKSLHVLVHAPLGRRRVGHGCGIPHRLLPCDTVSWRMDVTRSGALRRQQVSGGGAGPSVRAEGQEPCRSDKIAGSELMNSAGRSPACSSSRRSPGNWRTQAVVTVGHVRSLQQHPSVPRSAHCVTSRHPAVWVGGPWSLI